MSIWRPGPYATSLLVALGADVLKVEPPGGDPMRHYAGLFAPLNAGKRSVELDLKDGDGRDRALALAAEADVLVEGFRPGVMARLGLDDATVRAGNAAIVYCSISGYGQHGPRATFPGHDVNYQAWAGALTPEGGTAVIPPLPTADLAAGMTAAFGICAAVIARGTERKGDLPRHLHDRRHGDVDRALGRWIARSGRDPVRPRARLRHLLHRRRRADLPGGGQRAALLVPPLCPSRAGRAGGLGFDERCRRGEDMQRAIAAAVATHERDALVADLAAAGVPAAPVLDRQEMLASGPFPPFPIRLSLPATAGAVPALDQHHGEGFCDRT